MPTTILALNSTNPKKGLKETIEASVVSMKMRHPESKPLVINRIVCLFCTKLATKQKINMSIKKKLQKFICYCPDSISKLKAISQLLSTTAGVWSTILKRYRLCSNWHLSTTQNTTPRSVCTGCSLQCQLSPDRTNRTVKHTLTFVT